MLDFALFFNPKSAVVPCTLNLLGCISTCACRCLWNLFHLHGAFVSCHLNLVVFGVAHGTFAHGEPIVDFVSHYECLLVKFGLQQLRRRCFTARHLVQLAQEAHHANSNFNTQNIIDLICFFFGERNGTKQVHASSDRPWTCQCLMLKTWDDYACRIWIIICTIAANSGSEFPMACVFHCIFTSRRCQSMLGVAMILQGLPVDGRTPSETNTSLPANVACGDFARHRGMT